MRHKAQRTKESSEEIATCPALYSPPPPPPLPPPPPPPPPPPLLLFRRLMNTCVLMCVLYLYRLDKQKRIFQARDSILTYALCMSGGCTLLTLFGVFLSLQPFPQGAMHQGQEHRSLVPRSDDNDGYDHFVFAVA